MVGATNLQLRLIKCLLWSTFYKAGQDTEISISADAESDVFLLGVDKSVLLLATGNDINEKNLLEVASSANQGMD